MTSTRLLCIAILVFSGCSLNVQEVSDQRSGTGEIRLSGFIADTLTAKAESSVTEGALLDIYVSGPAGALVGDPERFVAVNIGGLVDAFFPPPSPVIALAPGSALQSWGTQIADNPEGGIGLFVEDLTIRKRAVVLGGGTMTVQGAPSTGIRGRFSFSVVVEESDTLHVDGEFTTE